MTNLNDLVEAYTQAEAKIKALETELNPLKEAKIVIKDEIAKLFKKRGEYSSRVSGATVSLAVRKTAVVVDEKKLISQLKKEGRTDYLKETTNEEFDTYKKLIATGDVDLPSGMEIKETEFVSIRTNNKAEPRKIVTEKFIK